MNQQSTVSATAVGSGAVPEQLTPEQHDSVELSAEAGAEMQHYDVNAQGKLELLTHRKDGSIKAETMKEEEQSTANGDTHMKHENGISPPSSAMKQEQPAAPTEMLSYDDLPMLELSDLPPRCRAHASSHTTCMPWCAKRWKDIDLPVPPPEAFSKIKLVLRRYVGDVHAPPAPAEPVVIDPLKGWSTQPEPLLPSTQVQAIQCSRCQKWRYVQTTQPPPTVGWTCEHNNTDSIHNNCDAPEEVYDSKVWAIDNFRTTNPWTVSTLGLAPITDALYDSYYSHPEWTKWETIVLLELVRQNGLQQITTFCLHPLLAARHSLDECEARILQMFATASLFALTVTKYGLTIANEAHQQQQQPQQRAQIHAPSAGAAAPRKAKTPSAPKTKRPATSPVGTGTGYKQTGSSATPASNRAAGRRASSRPVRYNYESDDEDIDKMINESERPRSPEPVYHYKIERVLAQKQKKVKVDAYGRFISDVQTSTMDDTERVGMSTLR